MFGKENTEQKKTPSILDNFKNPVVFEMTEHEKMIEALVESAKTDLRNEMEINMVKASEQAYQCGYNDAMKELSVPPGDYEALKQEHTLLQIKHDQLLRTNKELSRSLQFETGVTGLINE